MSPRRRSPLLQSIRKIRNAALHSATNERCLVSASPELEERLRGEIERVKAFAQKRKDLSLAGRQLRLPVHDRPGFNDGLIIPGTYFPVGTPTELIRSAAAERAPLTGTLRVVVVLVDFSDQVMVETQQHFEDLFFSTGVLPNGSVREYFAEASNNLVDIDGEVLGPYRMSQTLAYYANSESGIGSTLPNARTMAREAAIAANPDVDFSLYDNDGNGFVDAFIVVHAGAGAEVTGSTGDIWSHKWVISGSAYNADGTQIYAYLTVPEDAQIGVCSHELGHLLFGWPDLYDTDYSSEGIGNWCLMAGGSWNGGGQVPAHPSAWCKADQAWVSVVNHTANANVSIPDVKTSHQVHRLWKDGTSGSEYFLVENRQRTLYDRDLPGDGLLIWHVDETVANQKDETHPKIALEQADGLNQLATAGNRGDAGDPYPGTANNPSFTGTSTPNSKSYAGADTCVAVTNISASGATMTARFTVKCKTVEKPLYKETKIELKELRKDKLEIKEWKEKEKEKEKREKEKDKEFKELKEKDTKEFKEKDVKELKEKEKERKEIEKGLLGDKLRDKRPEKPETDKTTALDKNPVGEKFGEKIRDKLVEGFDWRLGTQGMGLEELEARIAALEAQLGVPQPFIPSELRPDLSQGALLAEDDTADLQKAMAEGGPGAKRSFDTRPPRA